MGQLTSSRLQFNNTTFNGAGNDIYQYAGSTRIEYEYFAPDVNGTVYYTPMYWSWSSPDAMHSISLQVCVIVLLDYYTNNVTHYKAFKDIVFSYTAAAADANGNSVQTLRSNATLASFTSNANFPVGNMAIEVSPDTYAINFNIYPAANHTANTSYYVYWLEKDLTC